MISILATEFPQIAARVCGGMRGNVWTPRGIRDRTTILSALQKFIRRGETERALEIAMEVVCLQMSNIANPSGLKAFISNVRNRLMICAVEDCLHPSMYDRIVKLAKTFERDRRSVAGVRALLEIVAVLAKSRKGRMPSVLKILRKPLSYDQEFCDRYKDILEIEDKGIDFNRFIEDLVRGKLTCVRHLDAPYISTAWVRLLEYIKRHENPGLRKCIEALHIMWKDVLPKNHLEGFIVLFQAIVIVVFHKNVICWDDSDVPDAEVPETDEGLMRAVRSHLNNDSPIVVPDYVYDMHTSKGRGLKRGSAHFAEIGSLVTNMATDVVPPEMMDEFVRMYVDSKKHELNP